MGLVVRSGPNLPKGTAGRLALSSQVIGSRLHEQELSAYKKLCTLQPVSRSHVRVLYPGSANDVFFPLLYVQALYCNVEQLHLILIDPDVDICMIKEEVEILTGIVGETDGSRFVSSSLVIDVFASDVFTFDSIFVSGVHMYMERAFLLWREKHVTFLSKIHASDYLITDNELPSTNIIVEGLGFYQKLFITKKEKITPLKEL